MYHRRRWVQAFRFGGAEHEPIGGGAVCRRTRAFPADRSAGSGDGARPGRISGSSPRFAGHHAGSRSTDRHRLAAGGAPRSTGGHVRGGASKGRRLPLCARCAWNRGHHLFFSAFRAAWRDYTGYRRRAGGAGVVLGRTHDPLLPFRHGTGVCRGSGIRQARGLAGLDSRGRLGGFDPCHGARGAGRTSGERTHPADARPGENRTAGAPPCAGARASHRARRARGATVRRCCSGLRAAASAIRTRSARRLRFRLRQLLQRHRRHGLLPLGGRSCRGAGRRSVLV